ncbi:helix-turn-helix transcriptional regulator [Cryptosporangium japonicum]|uniref:Helix-turn-helix transcriptional regulator n=2 Tax=Cryptosporangium japonicum TaxID=80872 RepID=A0ABN0UXC5_9ACTN
MKDSVRGHLDAMLLAVLEPGPLHGYAVIEALRQRSGGRFDLPTGTVYPALRALERAGYLSGSWSTVGGRKRRTYALTGSGRHALSAERTDWRDFSRALDATLAGEA